MPPVRTKHIGVGDQGVFVMGGCEVTSEYQYLEKEYYKHIKQLNEIRDRDAHIEYLEALLDKINNLCVEFHEYGPYCENEPPIILKTVLSIEQLSRLVKEDNDEHMGDAKGTDGESEQEQNI